MTKLDENVNDYCIKEVIEYIDSKTSSIKVKTRILPNSDNLNDLIKTWNNKNDVKITVLLAKLSETTNEVCQSMIYYENLVFLHRSFHLF
jgi:hypothetical protein